MNKLEKFENLQYETYKSLYLTFFGLAIVAIMAHIQASEIYKIILSFVIFIFSLVAIISLGLFFKFYQKLRKRYS